MQLLAKLRPKASHILIVERDDGHTFLKATFNPRTALQTLNGAGMLTHRWQAIDSPHAEEIALRVAGEFEVYRVDAHGPWFIAEYDDVLRTLQDFDIATGKRVRDDRFQLQQPVQVESVGRGVISAFSGRLIVVKLDQPRGNVSRVLAPRSLVKPVIRADASRGAAA